VLDDIRRQTEDIIRYYGELNRRVAATGTEGIAQLLDLSKQLESAMAEVAVQELTWVGAEIKRVLEELARMDTQLRHLRELKTALDRSDHEENRGRRSSL
jgi:hypothetical protein